MGCIQSKSATEDMVKRIDKLEAHMNLLDDDIYYIEKRLKRRSGKKTGARRIIDADEECLTDATIDSNTSTPPMASSPKTRSSMHERK